MVDTTKRQKASPGEGKPTPLPDADQLYEKHGNVNAPPGQCTLVVDVNSSSIGACGVSVVVEPGDVSTVSPIVE